MNQKYKVNEFSKNRDSKELTFLKNVVRKLQAEFGYIGRIHLQNDLAQHLKFNSWNDLIKAPSVKILQRIKENPLPITDENVFKPLLEKDNENGI